MLRPSVHYKSCSCMHPSMFDGMWTTQNPPFAACCQLPEPGPRAAAVTSGGLFVEAIQLQLLVTRHSCWVAADHVTKIVCCCIESILIAAAGQAVIQLVCWCATRLGHMESRVICKTSVCSAVRGDEGPGCRAGLYCYKVGAATLQAMRSGEDDLATSCTFAWSACAHWARCRPVSSHIE